MNGVEHNKDLKPKNAKKIAFGQMRFWYWHQYPEITKMSSIWMWELICHISRNSPVPAMEMALFGN